MSWLIADLEGGDRSVVINELVDIGTNEFAKRLKSSRRHLIPTHEAQDWIDKVILVHVELREVRHRIIHGWWASLNSERDYIVKKKKRGSAEEAQTFTLEKLIAVVNKLDELGMLIINARRVARGDAPVN